MNRSSLPAPPVLLAALLGLLLAPLVGCGTRPSQGDDDDDSASGGDDDDDDDVTTFDPSTLPQGDSPAHPPAWATVVSVIDGDTAVVELNSGLNKRVRFLSINTPELNSTSSQIPDCYAETARDRTASLLPVGATVWLTWDGLYEDAYNRLLAYIFKGAHPQLGEDYDDWINYHLVKDGYARAYIFDNNRTWEELFEDAEDEARTQGRGMWDACDY